MEDLDIRPFRSADTDTIVALWEVCELIPSHQGARDIIERKVAFQPELFWVATLDGKMVGTLMIGYEGRRGWLNALGVLPECRRRGQGFRRPAQGRPRHPPPDRSGRACACPEAPRPEPEEKSRMRP